MPRVMIVEDSAISARILEVNLRKANYETVIANTGKDALQALEANGRVDVIVTDIVMADMDGFQLLQEIKRSSRWKGIPVIMCSSLGDLENVRKAGAMGCRYYLVKPVQPGLLLRKIAEALESDKPVLRDRTEVLVQFGLDDDAYLEIADDFAELVREQIAVLERLERSRDPQLQPALRTLSEGASVLGADRLTECLGKLLVIWDSSMGIRGWVVGYKQLLHELKRLDEVLDPMIRRSCAPLTR